MTSPSRRTVLLTGATGYIASQLLPTFRDRYDLRLADVRGTDGSGQPVPGTQLVNLGNDDDSAVRPLFSGVDTVVHLAYGRPSDANLNPQTGFMSRGYLDERANVDMAQRVFQLSMEEGVRRVVMASSNHAADWYEHLIHVGKMDMVDPDLTPPKSDNYYGWAKCSTCRRFSLGAIRMAAPRSDQPIGVQSSRASYFPYPTRTGSARSMSTPRA